MSNNNIIQITPTLEAYEVEVNGKKFDCRSCMGLGDCCGTVDISNNKSSCYKCKCQSLYNSTNRTKENAEKTDRFINSTNCKNCDDSTFTKDFCESMAYLENNLDSDFTDCSNTLLVTGEYNTLNDIEQRTNCNIDGQQEVAVNNYNAPPPTENQSILDKIKGGGLSINIVFILILIALFYFRK